jgi:uncharacterized membrane protein
MQELMAIVFTDQDSAERLAASIAALEPGQRSWLKDAALVARDQAGDVVTYELPGLIGEGEFGGLFWGFLFALIFWTKWWDLSIPLTIQDDFVKSAGEAMGKGDSGLFIFTSDGDAALQVLDGLPALREQRVDVVRSALEPGELGLIQRTFRKK